MSFLKDFDTLFNEILTDYKNQFPGIDTSQGSLIFIKSACMASAIWGLYKYQEYISKQIFPDTADTANLDHHGWIWDISRTYNEEDDDYLSRILTHIRQRPAGGNKNDYVVWALEKDNVAGAYCYPLAQGLGTVDVLILANETNTGSEIPSSYTTIVGSNTSIAADKLIDSGGSFQSAGVTKGDVVENTTHDASTTVVSVDSEIQLTLANDIFTLTPDNYKVLALTQTVKDYIDDLRPVTAKVLRVLSPTKITQNVTMTVTGSNANTTQISSDITAYMQTLEPDQTLYVSQLISIAIDNGADNASVSTPAADVTPNSYEMIRAGTINVT